MACQLIWLSDIQLRQALTDRSRLEAQLAEPSGAEAWQVASWNDKLNDKNVLIVNLCNIIVVTFEELRGEPAGGGVPPDGVIFGRMTVENANRVLYMVERLLAFEVQRVGMETALRAKHGLWLRGSVRLLKWGRFRLHTHVFAEHVRLRICAIPVLLVVILGTFARVVLRVCQSLPTVAVAFAVPAALAVAFCAVWGVLILAASEVAKEELSTRTKVVKDLQESAAAVAAAAAADAQSAAAAAEQAAAVDVQPAAAAAEQAAVADAQPAAAAVEQAAAADAQPAAVAAAVGQVPDAFGQLPRFVNVVNNTPAQCDSTVKYAEHALLEAAVYSAV